MSDFRNVCFLLFYDIFTLETHCEKVLPGGWTVSLPHGRIRVCPYECKACLCVCACERVGVRVYVWWCGGGVCVCVCARA